VKRKKGKEDNKVVPYHIMDNPSKFGLKEWYTASICSGGSHHIFKNNQGPCSCCLCDGTNLAVQGLEVGFHFQSFPG